jgi:hypothetical protein
MKPKFSVALLFSVLSFHHAAHADDSKRLVETILAAGPMSCIEEASELMNRQFFRMTPDQLLGPMGRDKRTWKAGDPNYEKARRVIVNALQADEQKNGPLFSVTLPKLLTESAGRWNLDEQRYFISFFSTEAGKLYLDEIFNGAECSGVLKVFRAPPYPPLEGESKARVDSLIESLARGEARFLEKLARLSKEQRIVFNSGTDKLGHPFPEGIKQVAFPDTFKTRIETAVLPHAKEISTILNTAD